MLYISATKKSYGDSQRLHFDMTGDDTMTGGLQWMDDRPFDKEEEVDKAFLKKLEEAW